MCIMLEGKQVTVRNWLKFSSVALLLGFLGAVITSFFVRADAYLEYMNPLDFWELTGTFLWFSVLGLLYSVISQMGFFAYLTVHQFGRGFFGYFWKHAQIVIIAIVLFDLVYLRYTRVDEPGSIFPYIVVAGVLFIYSLAVAYVKKEETHPRAFLPAVFFMTVVTALEWIPGLRTNDPDTMMIMIVPLVACNTYQLLRLHHIVGYTNEKGEEVGMPNKAEDVQKRRPTDTKKKNKKSK